MTDSTLTRKGFSEMKTATKTKKSTKTSKSTKTATKAVKKDKVVDKDKVVKVAMLDYDKNVGQKGRTRLENVPQIVQSFDNAPKQKGKECRALSCIMLFLSSLKCVAMKIKLSSLLSQCLNFEKLGKKDESKTKLAMIAISDKDISDFFIKQFKFNFQSLPINFNDNVIHQSMYSMSKVETNEQHENKEKKLVDSFAVGAREFFRRDSACGIKSSGKYTLNPTVEYELHNITLADARTMGLVALRSRASTESVI